MCSLNLGTRRRQGVRFCHPFKLTSNGLVRHCALQTWVWMRHPLTMLVPTFTLLDGDVHASAVQIMSRYASGSSAGVVNSPPRSTPYIREEYREILARLTK